MKTTVELPDEVMISLKVKAAKEGKKLKTLIEEALRQFLFPEEGEREKVRRKGMNGLFQLCLLVKWRMRNALLRGGSRGN